MKLFVRIQQLYSAFVKRQHPVVAKQEAGRSTQQYERAVLDLFARGFLTLDLVMERLPYAS